jgi:hypothetical protein
MRRALLISILALLSSRAAAQSPVDSLPPTSARVRVIAPRLGTAWHIGLLNALQVSSSCYRVLLFTPTGALRILATLEPSELTRLQVAVRRDGRVLHYNPSARGAAVPGERWREVRLALFEPSTRACHAKTDSTTRSPR